MDDELIDMVVIAVFAFIMECVMAWLVLFEVVF